MAQATEDEEALPITLLVVGDSEAFLILKIPPKAKSSAVLCEQWPHRSPKDDPNIVIPIRIELIDKNTKGLWMYLKKRKQGTDEYDIFLHFKLDRELPTVEQAYDSSRYFQLSIPKPGGNKNEMAYLGLRDDSKQLQDEMNTYWRALDSALEVQQMPEEDWTLGDDAQISIGGKGAVDNGTGNTEQKAQDASSVMPLAAPKTKSKKTRKKADKVETSSDPKNQPKSSVFDDNFGNDFDANFGNVAASASNGTDTANKDDTNNANNNNGDKGGDTGGGGDSGWTDFDF